MHESVLFADVSTDPLLGQSLSEPVRDQFDDVGGLAPAAHAVQQLAILRWHCRQVHLPQSGQNATAGDTGAHGEGGF